ncbi:unknown [Diachasmimorpha longicaudata entomopoxvirus]|nr:hypothetical protein FLA14_p209 [Diachasmimorpha longicaudata entomopoxvirus]AAN88026.1 unknown [Diachasmimorpha longicaudata entomopoxvirus]
MVLEVENTTNVPHEALLPIGRMPLELLFGEENLNDFLIEKTTDENLDNYNYMYPSGFFIDIPLETKHGYLTLYDYITPFAIIQNKIHLVPKTETMKYWIFFNSPRESKKGVHLTFFNLFWESAEMDDALIDNFISTFKLKMTRLEFKNMFTNAHLLVNKTQRFIACDNFHAFKDGDNYTLKMYIDLYFLQNLDIQIDFYCKLVSKALNNIKHVILKILPDFKSDGKSDFFENANEEIRMMQIKLMSEQTNKIKYFKIKDEYNSIIKYLCDLSGIPFGKKLLILQNDLVFDSDRILKNLSYTENLLLTCLNGYKDEIVSIFEKKQKEVSE